jgi:bla regulator protein BlaR1
LIPGLASGKRHYDRMSPGLADATRQQLPALQPWLTSLGSLVSVKFTNVDPQGADIYDAQFEHGSAECHIHVDADGTIEGALLRPLP